MSTTTTPTKSDPACSFNEFMKERKAASDAFVDGNVGPLIDISTTTPPASMFGPAGTCIQEPAGVNRANEAGSKSFEPGGENRFEIMHAAADGDLAYWTGLQRSVVRTRDSENPVPMDLRITEIFRRETTNGNSSTVTPTSCVNQRRDSRHPSPVTRRPGAVASDHDWPPSGVRRSFPDACEPWRDSPRWEPGPRARVCVRN